MGEPLMGRYASFKLGTDLVENLGKWTLDIKTEEIDVSVFGSVWGRTIPGMQKWTGTIEGFYDPADITGQLALQNDMIGATKITDLRFYVDSTSYWAPDTESETTAGAYITGISISHDKAGVAAVTMNVVGYGKLKFT